MKARVSFNKCKVPHQVGGTYLVMEGLQFSSLASQRCIGLGKLT